MFNTKVAVSYEQPLDKLVFRKGSGASAWSFVFFFNVSTRRTAHPCAVACILCLYLACLN